jgi:hypothetical protein
MARSFFGLTGRVAVVVGGTSGIGRVLALGLADAGATVVVTARRAAYVDEVAAEIEARGRKTQRMRTPMRRFGEIEERVGAGVFLASDPAASSPGSCSWWTEGSWRAERISSDAAQDVYATFGAPKCCCTTSVTAPRNRGCIAGSVGTISVVFDGSVRRFTTSRMIGPIRSHAAVTSPMMTTT